MENYQQNMIVGDSANTSGLYYNYMMIVTDASRVTLQIVASLCYHPNWQLYIN